MSESSDETYRTEPCPCPEVWAATVTYTAKCPVGTNGDPVTATRQYVSQFSLKHAQQEAFKAAKAAAEAALVCTWNVTQCVRAPCVVTVATVVSRAADVLTVEWVHEPPFVPFPGESFAMLSPDESFEGEFAMVEQVAPDQIRIEPDPGEDVPAGTTIRMQPTSCCAYASQISFEDAQLRAFQCAAARIAHICEYGAAGDPLDPIGGGFL